MDPFYSQLLVTATLITIAALFTVIAFDTWQTVLLTILFLVGMNYLIILSLDRLTTINYGSISEGFVTQEKGGSDAALSKYEWLSNDDLFDDFYASVFTKLTQNENLIQAETAICMEEFTRDTPKDQLNILDAGCGIGIATCALAKQGAGQVVGIDKSQAMIRYAKGTTLPSTTLTETERQNVEFRMFDLMGPGAAGAAEFTNACILYFTIYYFKDLDILFRNLALWVKPGGSLAIDPWVGVSPQNYVKERLKTSKVVFDKFDYEATFELEDPNAEFRETFRFKDGSTRRQKHDLTMPSMSEIIKKAQRNGWMYSSYVDLMPLSFQYGYLLFFKRISE